MAAKKSPAKSAPKKAKAISEVMSKTDLVAYIVEQTEVAKKDVVAVLGGLEQAMTASVAKKGGAGAFVLPGLLKVLAVSVPAQPKRKGINPFTKEETVFAAKPASTKIKVRPLKKLKDAAL